MENEILAVQSKDVSEITKACIENNGFKLFENEEEYEELLNISLTKQRGKLENDSSYKQIIPYLMMLYKNKIFYYIRAQGGNEARLHNKLSIGVGGHIEIEDTESPDETIRHALIREAQEEIGENINLSNIYPLGFIYTEQSEVDQVHLGILFVGDILNEDINVNHEEVGENGFLNKQEMDKLMHNGNYTPENWTRIAWCMAQELIN